MGRYYYGQGRHSTEDYPKQLDIKFLKKHLYLDKDILSKGGTISWLRNGEKYSSIGIKIEKNDTKGNMRVQFSQTDNQTGEKKDFDYKIKLESTPCNYGGVRWWFICPCEGNRCGVLYLQSNGYFASRKTLNLCYAQQKESKRSRLLSYIMGDACIKSELIRRTMKYPVRNGKFTRKARRIINLQRQIPSIEEVNNMGKILGWDKQLQTNDFG